MLKFIKSRFKKNHLNLSRFIKTLSIRKLKNYPDFDPDKPFYAFITLSILLREKGEFKEAIHLLKKLENERLSSDERKLLLLNLIVTYKRAGFLGRAEKQALMAIDEFPSESIFYKELADVKLSMNDLESAVDFLEKAMRYSDDFKKELFYLKLFLASTYIDAGRLDDALRVLKKVEPIFPVPLFYYTLSKIFFALGEEEKAISNAVTGIRLSRDNSAVFFKLLLKYVSPTEEFFESLLKEAGDNYFILVSFIDTLISKGKLDKALKFIERGVSKFPLDPTLRKRQFEVMYRLGLKDQAADGVMSYLEILEENRERYKCCVCGYGSLSFSWLCPRCRSWETLELNVE